MKVVSMIGLGYIGLPTAAVMAKSGFKVIGVDIDQSICNTINAGQIHIVEPGLAEVVREVVQSGNLVAQTYTTEADVYVIAVPTPFKSGYEPDCSYIEQACKAIAPVLRKGCLVILESTSPVGTLENVAMWLSELRHDLCFDGGDLDVNLAYCPERVLPGNVLFELKHNSRIIGGMTANCSSAAKEFYSLFVDGECSVTNSRTAEMVKLTENSFRDVNIAFANELSIICEHLNINVWEMIKLANMHPRVNILQPGCGVGGHCIAVDPWFIVNKTPTMALLIRQAREINDGKPMWVAKKIKDMVFDFLQGNPERTANSVRVACFGLTFKPDIDDLRESPAVDVLVELHKIIPNISIEVVEPNISSQEKVDRVLGSKGTKLMSLEDAKAADIKIFLVGHKVFKAEPELQHGEYVLNFAWNN
jgi:UDP-N-acetyl-D-mannosaminuronic acid dehydrogenase